MRRVYNGASAMSDYYVTWGASGEPKTDLRLTGGPIDSFEAHEKLFAAIGYAAMSWARFETHLDAILIQVNAAEHSKDIYRPDHPITFDRKVQLLKRWFNQHPGLAHLKDSMRALTSRAKELSKTRNQFLHCILEDWDASKQHARFNGLKWMGNDEWHATVTNMDLEFLHSFARRANIGNKWLEEMSRTLFTAETLERLRVRCFADSKPASSA
jgi:hypothetical protein